jgi:phosphoserine phosphatase RsbU/P
MIELKYGTRRVISYRGAKKVVGGLTDKNRIDVLLYISKELANVEKEEDLFQTLINLCKEIFECENATLRIFDGDFLVPVKFIKNTVPPRRNLKEVEGFSGRTYSGGKPLLVPNIRKDPAYVDEFETTECVMCVPIIYREEKMGTLSVESDVAFFYKEDDLEILEALGAQLGLALSGVRMIEGLMTARAREAAVLSQLEWDLKMGRNVQSQIIQNTIQPWNGIHFASYYEPMVEVSGDYYSIVRSGNTATIIIVDVSGHGIPAALVTMAIHYKFHQCVEEGLGLSEIMEEMGESLKPQLPESTYFTAFLLRIFSDNTFAYINGGHPRAIYLKNDCSSELLDTKGVPLGILPVKKYDYEEKHGKLEPGEILVLYSDGMPEQKNKIKEEFSHERFLAFFTENYKHLKDKKEIMGSILVSSLLTEFNHFSQDTKRGDDLTLLLMECNPTIQNTVPLIRMAKEAYKLKSYNDAYLLFQQVYTIDKSIKDNLLFMGKLCYTMSKYIESVKYLEEYIASSGDEAPTVYFLYAKALFKADKIRETKRALKKSLSGDPSFAKASLLLAKCYLIENSIPKAIRTLKQGVKSSPENDPLKAVLTKLESMK